MSSITTQPLVGKYGSHNIPIGTVFDRLTVVDGPIRQGGKCKYRCRCKCTRETVVRGTHLLSEHHPTRSCGCLRHDVQQALNTTHGGTGTRLYGIWRGMHNRCNRRNNRDWPRYGGRGITIHHKWKDYPSFRDWALANGYRDDLSIDRIDNDAGYSPENCRWATTKQQSRNKRNSKMVTAFGQIRTAKDWEESNLCTVNYSTLFSRLCRGWDVERAILAPPRIRNTP